MMKDSKIEIFAYYLSILLNLLIVFAVYATLTENGFNNLFNSDCLYMSSIYKDLFIDGNTLKGWNLNTVPLIFPNVIVYSIFNAITGDFKIAYLLHGIFQYLSILLILNYLFVAVNNKISKLVLASANLLIGIFLISLIINDDAFIFALFLLPYHTGAFIITLLCFAWLIKYFKNGENKYLYLIAVFLVLTLISDRIFIVYFSIPSFVTMLFLLLYKQYPKKELIKAMVVIVITSLASIILLRLIYLSDYVSFFKIDLLVSARVDTTLKIMVEQYYTYIAEATLKGTVLKLSILFLIILFIKLYLEYRKMKSLSDKNSIFIFLLFSTIFITGTWLAPGISGQYQGFDCIRYNIWAIVMLLGVFPFLVNLIVNKKMYTFILFFILIISFIISAFLVNNLKESKYNIKAYFNYYPELTAQADTLAMKYNLKYGVGEYWAAKQITMFSKTGLRIFSVYDDLNPFILSANQNWYFNYNEKKPGNNFNFIIANKTSTYIDSIKFRFRGDSIIETNLGERYNLFIVPSFHYDYGTFGIIMNEQDSSVINKINKDK